MKAPRSSNVAGIKRSSGTPEATSPATDAPEAPEGPPEDRDVSADSPSSTAPPPTSPSEPVSPPEGPSPAPSQEAPGGTRPIERLTAVQDRLAGWISDLTALHDLTERLARTDTLDGALHELLRAGATLVGAQRGMIALEAPKGFGPEHILGLGLGRAELGEIETVPRASASYARLLDGLPLPEQPQRPPQDGEEVMIAATHRVEIVHADIASDASLDPLHREVAARLGMAASYALALATEDSDRMGAAVWFYDEPAEPTQRQRHLLSLYARYASEHVARQMELSRARETTAIINEELLPTRLPLVNGVTLAVRHQAAPEGGGDWFDALALPEGALGLSVGGVDGGGPRAMAAMGRMRASMRAYAVMEGEDPVAVLSDLELLLRLTEPGRTATALFGYAEPESRTLVVAGAGHCPPLIIGPYRTEFAETSLSAPLGMLACWEAPSVTLSPQPGETVLLYTDGLLHRTGKPMELAFAALQQAAANAPAQVRDEPELLLDHLLRTVLPNPAEAGDTARLAEAGEDLVLLAAQFD